MRARAAWLRVRAARSCAASAPPGVPLTCAAVSASCACCAGAGLWRGCASDVPAPGVLASAPVGAFSPSASLLAVLSTLQSLRLCPAAGRFGCWPARFRCAVLWVVAPACPRCSGCASGALRGCGPLGAALLALLPGAAPSGAGLRCGRPCCAAPRRLSLRRCALLSRDCVCDLCALGCACGAFACGAFAAGLRCFAAGLRLARFAAGCAPSRLCLWPLG